jgi:hypothetical protein
MESKVAAFERYKIWPSRASRDFTRLGAFNIAGVVQIGAGDTFTTGGGATYTETAGTHAPDKMLLNANHIIMVEPVTPGSTVAKLIDQAAKQK